MKAFSSRQIAEAKAYAMEGGQSLHLHRIIANRQKAPRCFVQAVDRGEQIAHLFDQDEARLVATVKRLGLKVVKVERRGEPGQHVDLCGNPLRKALALAEGTAPCVNCGGTGQVGCTQWAPPDDGPCLECNATGRAPANEVTA